MAVLQPRSKHRTRVLNKDQVAELRALRKAGAKQVDLAKQFGIAQQTVSQILSGETWVGVKPAKLDKGQRGRPKNDVQRWYDDEGSKLERVIAAWESRGNSGLAEHFRGKLAELRLGRPKRLREDKPPPEFVNRDLGRAAVGLPQDGPARTRRDQAIYTAFDAVSTYYECLLLLPKDDQLPRLRDKALASLSEVHRITREAQMGAEVETALADFDPRKRAVGVLNLHVGKAKGRTLAAINAVAKDLTIDGVREVVMPHDETQLISGKIQSRRKQRLTDRG